MPTQLTVLAHRPFDKDTMRRPVTTVNDVAPPSLAGRATKSVTSPVASVRTATVMVVVAGCDHSACWRLMAGLTSGSATGNASIPAALNTT